MARNYIQPSFPLSPPPPNLSGVLFGMTEQQLRRLEDTVFPTPKTPPGRIFLKNNCTSRLYPKPCKISGAIFAVLMQTHCPEHVITQGLWETMGKHMLAICRPVSNPHTTTHTQKHFSLSMQLFPFGILELLHCDTCSAFSLTWNSVQVSNFARSSKCSRTQTYTNLQTWLPSCLGKKSKQ